MRQRRSGVRSETTAARSTLENLARCRAAIYPVLGVEIRGGRRSDLPRSDCVFLSRSGGPTYDGLHPGLVRGRPVDRRDLAIGHAEIDGELTAVVHLVHQHEPQQVHLAHITHLLRRHEELHCLIELRVECLEIRSTNALEDCSYTATTSVNVAGALGILPNSIPTSNACSLAFCSVTNIHASSLADLHLACGFRSAFAAG